MFSGCNGKVTPSVTAKEHMVFGHVSVEAKKRLAETFVKNALIPALECRASFYMCSENHVRGGKGSGASGAPDGKGAKSMKNENKTRILRAKAAIAPTAPPLLNAFLNDLLLTNGCPFLRNLVE